VDEQAIQDANRLYCLGGSVSLSVCISPFSPWALIFHSMIVIAVYALHIGHPGNLGKGRVDTSSPESKISEQGRIEEVKP